jgi:hypothetical protein
MHDIFTSIKAYLYDRSASPLFGAFLVSWSAWNYRFFVILFSNGLSLPADKFSEIDSLFAPHLFALGDLSISISGKLLNGGIVPALIALTYLYVYPLIAKPVYEHSLKKQKKLRAVKQEQEDQRLLSAEESREIYRKLAQMQSKHQEEIDSNNNQISALNQHIETLNRNVSSSIDVKFIDKEPNLDWVNEDDLKEYDNIIFNAVNKRVAGTFRINDLFGQTQWSNIQISVRQALGKRFRKQVERGDFVGITMRGKDAGNQQEYFKAPK